MTFRPIIIFSSLLAVLFFALLWTGCGEQDDQVLGPTEETEAIDSQAWLWAFASGEDSLRVYDSATGDLKATFFAQPHAILHEVKAGPEEVPTVWMGSGGTGFAFTSGFETHGDHAHMVLPTSLGTVPTGANNTHLTTDSHGETVSWANDGDQNFTLVDVETLTPVTVGHGSPHSGSLVAHETLLATHMNEKWARIIDTQSGEIMATVGIDTLAHGEAYHEDSNQAFIPCLNGVTVVGLDEQENLGLISYPDDGRVNFLFSGHDSDYALAPVKLAAGDASEVWILDMANHDLVDIPLAGSALAWNRTGGNLSLSEDGTTAFLTDLETAHAYVVNLAVGTAETLDIEMGDMACASGFAGEKLWLLDKESGDIHYRFRYEGAWEEGSGFTIHPGSDWIFITSLDPLVEIILDY